MNTLSSNPAALRAPTLPSKQLDGPLDKVRALNASDNGPGLSHKPWRALTRWANMRRRRDAVQTGLDDVLEAECGVEVRAIYPAVVQASLANDLAGIGEVIDMWTCLSVVTLSAIGGIKAAVAGLF